MLLFTQTEINRAMAINHRASTISIAIITIIFGVITVYNSSKFDKKAFSRDLSKTAMESEKFELLRDVKDITDTVSILNKVGLAFGILSIVASIAMFAVVSKDQNENKSRRQFLLPYIIVNAMVVIVGVISLAIIADLLKDATSVVSILIVFSIIGILLRILFVSLASAHFKSLSSS